MPPPIFGDLQLLHNKSRLFQNSDLLGLFTERFEQCPAGNVQEGLFDLTTIFHSLQRQLFPALQEEVGPLSALDRQFCEVMALTQLGRFTQEYEGCGEGCPPCSRTWLAHAFIAKCV